VKVNGTHFELEDGLDIVEADKLLAVEDDVLEDKFEEVEEETLTVEDDDVGFDDTSAHNATRKIIKNFESMMRK
jgi:hypothetical protein